MRRDNTILQYDDLMDTLSIRMAKLEIRQLSLNLPDVSECVLDNERYNEQNNSDDERDNEQNNSDNEKEAEPKPRVYKKSKGCVW